MDQKVIEASYVVALEIAKQKNTYNWENLNQTLSSQNDENCLGKWIGEKLAADSLSYSTVQRRISDMTIDIKDQVVQKIKSAAFGLFSIQLDELTNVASCSQLLEFARYVHSGAFREEFLFCFPLETTTNASDILIKVSYFFESENIL
ncbi:protein FAM200C-like isoform X1 [Tachypleus tridentatus]|uniref:protein FAM200C-like isoform X1 n=1 Tax=Tachypleus tridentatus TaxID=6853 RepID=UPI003FD18CB8